ncbi:hypothetical protein GIB67_038899 [Kingdonia uniflora]|uniref:S1 motif domain-containing protein n=1 Tax=Kingdonia uniflora TaxID=39325 RepID=A0A7J7KZ05_9MAGN|nr:hypothetical protein GIB67_038899 [Kingdonia uniflora]
MLRGSGGGSGGGSEECECEYYEPKPGDYVVGVVVSVSVLLCDLEKDAEEFMVKGKMGIVRDDDAVNGEPVPGRPIVETGTVLFAEIKQLNEPIEVRITEWNTGGLLTRIEYYITGLRAFIPKAELMNKVNNFTDLKQNVSGRRIFVQISRIDEDKNDLILSEREKLGSKVLYLQEGTLLEGTVQKLFPYGAQVRIGDTNRSGLLHISNITHSRVTSVSDLLTVDEKVKVLVVKSMFPDKISLSIADLESETGLFLSNKERVFFEAENMAKKYKQKLASFPQLVWWTHFQLISFLWTMKQHYIQTGSGLYSNAITN